MIESRKLSSWGCLLVLLVAVCPADARAATFVVTSTGDSGAGTLRDAILSANASPGADTITFNITGPGVLQIAPLADLPAITDDVTIDGFSQPGAARNTLAVGSNATLRIELRGPAGGGSGVVISGNGVRVQGLVINGFNATADSAGIVLSNPVPPVPYDLYNNLVEGCHIGTDATGTVAIPNSIGILVTGQQNRLGTYDYVPLYGGRLLVSGNSGPGIRISGGEYTVIESSYIGLNAAGSAPLGNGGDGVWLDGVRNTRYNEVGRASVLERRGNLIGGNGGAGVRMSGPSTSSNRVAGSVIGTDWTGTASLGNLGDGVLIEGGAGTNEVGNVGSNLIAYNGGAGVSVTGDGKVNIVLDNALYGNAGQNLDLGGDGRTLNDACDADDGPNRFQNTAVLDGFVKESGVWRLKGSLDSVPLGVYNVWLYSASSGCDSANPETRRFYGYIGNYFNGESCTLALDTEFWSLFMTGDAYATVIVQGTNGDMSEISNCIPIPAELVGGPNLGLQMLAWPIPATKGQPLTYTLAVNNYGMGDATSVQVTDLLPAGLTVQSLSSGCVNASGTVTCDLGTVPGNGGFTSVEIVAVPQVKGAITNTATVQLAETDPDLSDNSTSLLVDVEGGLTSDLRAVVAGGSAGCSGNTKKRTCTVRGNPAFLYNDDPYFDSALDLTATCKKPGTTSESCQFKGTYAIRSLDLGGVPAHSVSVYLSSDTAWDAGDRALATATSAVLAQLAPKKKALKISSKLPTGQGLSGKYILLRVDSGNVVAEDDEANNVAAIGPLP